MRFLADESCDFAVVRALREASHDVVSIAEIFPRAEDRAVIEMALKEKRVLLTEDKEGAALAYLVKNLFLVPPQTHSRRGTALRHLRPLEAAIQTSDRVAPRQK